MGIAGFRSQVPTDGQPESYPKTYPKTILRQDHFLFADHPYETWVAASQNRFLGVDAS
jgi:hypothetical protein